MGKKRNKEKNRKQTYKLPKMKIPLIAIFLLLCICRPHNHGIGKTRIAKLVRISGGDEMKYAT